MQIIFIIFSQAATIRVYIYVYLSRVHNQLFADKRLPTRTETERYGCLFRESSDKGERHNEYQTNLNSFNSFARIFLIHFESLFM